MIDNIKNNLIARVQVLLKEHDKIVKHLENTFLKGKEVTKDEKISLSVLSIKTIFIEAMIYQLKELIKSEFNDDINNYISKEHAILIDQLKEHAANKIELTDEGIKLSPDFQGFINVIKEKNGSKQE